MNKGVLDKDWTEWNINKRGLDKENFDLEKMRYI